VLLAASTLAVREGEGGRVQFEPRPVLESAMCFGFVSFPQVAMVVNGTVVCMLRFVRFTICPHPFGGSFDIPLPTANRIWLQMKNFEYFFLTSMKQLKRKFCCKTSKATLCCEQPTLLETLFAAEPQQTK